MKTLLLLHLHANDIKDEEIISIAKALQRNQVKTTIRKNIGFSLIQSDLELNLDPVVHLLFFC